MLTPTKTSMTASSNLMSRDRPTTQNRLHHPDILIVDDNHTNLRILVKILSEQGYKARSTSNGRLALSLAQADPPDLILLDIVMPELDGYQVCEQLKQHEATRDIPVLFISALDELVDKVRAFSAGAVDFISKPFHVEEVLARIKTHLTLHRLQQDQTRKNHALEREVADRKRAEAGLQEANQDLQRRVDGLSALNRIAQIVASTLDLQRMLAVVSEELVQIFAASSTGIMLLDIAKNELTVFADYSVRDDIPSMVGATMSPDTTLAAQQIFKRKKPFVFTKAQTNPLIKNSRSLLRERQIECLMVVPLLVRGEVIGTIGIDTDQPNREFTAADVSLAETIAAHIAGAIENARLFQQERRLRREAESLREVATVLSASLDEQTVLTKILEQLRQVVRYDSASVFLREGNELVLVAGTDLAKPHIGNRLSLAERAPGIGVFKQKQPLIIPDIHTHPRWQWVWEGLEYIRGWMCVPLVVNERSIGILCVDSFYPDTYTPADAQLVQFFANQAAIAIDNARLFDETQQANQRLQALYEHIQDDLALAREIQNSLLPPPRPAYEALEIVCHTQPVEEIGGDFYSYYAFPPPFKAGHKAAPQRFGIAVGDVSGKGVAAALLMAASLAQFEAVLAEDLPPAERIRHLDRTIATYTQPRQQNCALCYIELTLPDPDGERPGELHIVNAGCIPPYLKRRNGVVEWREIGGFALGQALGEEIGYREMSLPLAPGDLIILTSDGVVEATNAAAEMFGFDRLYETIVAGPTDSAPAMLDHLRAGLSRFMGAAKPLDDVTIIVVQV